MSAVTFVPLRVRGGMGIVKERFSEGHPLKEICFRITLALTLLTLTELVAARPHVAHGNLLWQQTLNGTATGFNFNAAHSVAVDKHGNVVAAGYTANTGTSFDFTVAKFDRDGTLLWLQTLNGTAANSNDLALSVAVDTQGNVVAAGYTENAGTGNDFTVAKFDRDGTVIWQQTLNGTANDFDAAVSVAVDYQGNVVAAGRKVTGTSQAFTVAKF